MTTWKNTITTRQLGTNYNHKKPCELSGVWGSASVSDAFWLIFSKYNSHKEILNTKGEGNGNGKRGKGQKPTGQTTYGGEPRTTTHHTCPIPHRKNPFPLSPTPNIGALEWAMKVNSPLPDPFVVANATYSTQLYYISVIIGYGNLIL